MAPLSHRAATKARTSQLWKKPQDKNIMSASATQGGHKKYKINVKNSVSNTAASMYFVARKTKAQQ